MLLRDPLSWVSVRYKLALTFAAVCLLAFGVGGFYVSGTAKDTLEAEILSRLEYQARAYAVALEGRLQTLARRTEDYASDGYIRDATESMLRGEGAGTDLEAELSTHLLVNKLPLEPAFKGLTLIGTMGEVVHTVGVDPSDEFLSLFRRNAAPGRPWYSGHLESEAPDRAALMAIATPIRSRRRGHEIGHLVAWIYQGTWIRGALETFDSDRPAHTAPVSLQILDTGGNALSVPSCFTQAGAPRPDSEVALLGTGLRLSSPAQASRHAGEAQADRTTLSHSFPIESNGWRIVVELRSREALAAIGGMQSRFIGVGLILALFASALMYFPLRFLARPLLQMAAAARSIRDGDFSTRVEVSSDDEIGELGKSFNTMADAIQERTQRLESTASSLRERQAELGFERDRLGAVISSMRDGLILLDEQGRPVLHNHAARPMLEQLDNPIGVMRPRHNCERQGGDDSVCLGCQFAAKAPDRSCVLEFSGGVYEIHSTRLRGGGGRVLVSRDLSDRIAQDERQIHQERLAVLGEVAAVMAHELNNPLAAISMYNQMTAQIVQHDDDLRENTEVIQRNVQSCKRAIRELLDYATKSTPEVLEVDLEAVLEDVVVFLRPLSRRFGVEVELEPIEEELIVSGDDVQIRQIFVNLVVNAIQAMGGRAGSVRIVARGDEGQAWVEVRDDGPGIPEHAREQIFRPFFTTKARGEGTGLGLPTSRRIAEMHGGGVELTRSDEKGTTFRVRLRRPQPRMVTT